MASSQVVYAEQSLNSHYNLLQSHSKRADAARKSLAWARPIKIINWSLLSVNLGLLPVSVALILTGVSQNYIAPVVNLVVSAGVYYLIGWNGRVTSRTRTSLEEIDKSIVEVAHLVQKRARELELARWQEEFNQLLPRPLQKWELGTSRGGFWPTREARLQAMELRAAERSSYVPAYLEEGESTDVVIVRNAKGEALTEYVNRPNLFEMIMEDLDARGGKTVDLTDWQGDEDPRRQWAERPKPLKRGQHDGRPDIDCFCDRCNEHYAAFED